MYKGYVPKPDIKKTNLEKLQTIKPEQKTIVQGNGVLVMHGTRLDVDETMRISDISKNIETLASRVLNIEKKLGLVTGSEQESLPGIIIGIWSIAANGTTLEIKGDENEGSAPRAWGVPKQIYTLGA